MEEVSLEFFNKLKPSTIPMVQFNSRLSDKSDQYSITTATHISILLRFILYKRDYSSILDSHVGSHGWLRKVVSF